MAQSIHFICEREGTGLKGLTLVDRATRLYRSCCWDLTSQEAESLIGGWLYLHPTKRQPSDFGGRLSGLSGYGTKAAQSGMIGFGLSLRPDRRVRVRNGAAKTTGWRIPTEPSRLTFPTS
jgi:hypothetical protein